MVNHLHPTKINITHRSWAASIKLCAGRTHMSALDLLTVACVSSCSTADQSMHSLTDWLLSCGRTCIIGSFINLGFSYRNLAWLPLAMCFWIGSEGGAFVTWSVELLLLEVVDILSVLDSETSDDFWSGLWHDPSADRDRPTTKWVEWGMDMASSGIEIWGHD